MDRRRFLSTATTPILLAAVPLIAPEEFRTRWNVRGSEGFDALSFLSPLSGDPFYARYYEDEIAAFAPRLPVDTMEIIRSLKQRTADLGILLSPYLDLRFSGGPDNTIEDLLGALKNAETVLRPPFEASPYWANEEDWGQFISAAPAIGAVLAAMREAGFAEFRESLFEPLAAERFPTLQQRLASFDVIAEVEHFTGQRRDPEVEVVLLQFCKPHGVKVLGQTFLSAIDWSDEIVLRTAGHELLHPPVDEASEAWAAALAIFQRDALLNRIVGEHDPAFGYNSLEGLMDEDLASAIDQLIGERNGIARDPRERWNETDGGMHVLSAGLYGLMKLSGFAETGGNLEHWLGRMALYGWLAPPMLHGAAAQVLGRPMDRLWPLPN